jgi:alkylation response protein AidB-like acyl-CoA dehydrogenase
LSSIQELRKKYFGAIGASEEDMEIVKAVRDFVDGEIMPHRQDLDGGWHRDGNLARETFERIHQGLVDIGYQRATAPERYGGLGVRGLTSYMTREEVSRGDPGIATHIGIIGWTMRPAQIARRTDLLEVFYEKICDDEPHTSCMAITEPSGGANVEDRSQHGSTIETTAQLDGDDWVINGTKIWPSGAGVSDITYCTVCTTDPNMGDDGIAIIYIPPGSEGLSFSEPVQKMGMCWTDINAEIFYDDVRVPKEYRVSGPGEDARILHDIVATGRLATCEYALGPAQACFEIALNWTREREIVGKPVRDRSLFASILGEMALRIESARAYRLEVSRMLGHPDLYGRPGQPFLLSKCSAAKAYACDVALWVANKAMELMGSYGYSFEYNLERYLRDVKILQLWLGGPQRALLDSAQGYYSYDWA